MERTQRDESLKKHMAGNMWCADCGVKESDLSKLWASLTYGVVLCIECAGAHRAMGTADKVVSFGIDSWSDGDVEAFVAMGGNQVLEANARVASTTPHENVATLSRGKRHAFVAAKWGGKRWDPHCADSLEQTNVSAGILRIRLIDGKNLHAGDVTGKSDPFCVFGCGRHDKHHKLRTSEAMSSVQKQTLNPVWNETLMLNVPSLDETLTVWVWDWDHPPKKPDSLGFAHVSLAGLRDGEELIVAPPLSKKGFVRFALTFTRL